MPDSLLRLLLDELSGYFYGVNYFDVMGLEMTMNGLYFCTLDSWMIHYKHKDSF